MEASVIALSL